MEEANALKILHNKGRQSKVEWSIAPIEIEVEEIK